MVYRKGKTPNEVANEHQAIQRQLKADMYRRQAEARKRRPKKPKSKKPRALPS